MIDHDVIANHFGLPRIKIDPISDPFIIRRISKIKKVIFNDPATIVIWDDGTKTVVKCQEGDVYNAELGLAMCISKKYFGNKGNFNEVFKKWIPEEKPLPLGFKYEEDEISEGKMRNTIREYCNDRYCNECVINHLPDHIPGHCSTNVTHGELIRNYKAVKKANEEV
jgi:hypothetical protein